MCVSRHASPSFPPLPHRLFENFDVPRDDPKRTRVEVLFSPGASVDPGSGRPYPPYDSLSASETHLHLSSELSGSLLKSHSVPLNTSSSPNSSRPTSTHGSRASARGRGFGRSSSAFAVGAAATPPLPPSAAPGPPPSLFDQENHTLGVLPCIPLSPPSLTLGYIEALLLRAIESVGADGASTGKSY